VCSSDLCATGTGCGAPGTALASYTYSLGPAGHRLSVAELSGRNVGYSYDGLYRLTSEAVSGDPAGGDGRITYTYDPAGNRLQRNSSLPTVPATGILNYDANDRPTIDPYDPNGNLLNSGVGTNIYDFQNRLVQAGGVSLVYDGDGNRVSETVAGVTTNYLVANQNLTGYAQVLDEIQAGAVTRTYSYGLQLIDEQQPISGTPTTSFYGYDGHGSIRFLTDSTGAITDNYDYDAFGNLISQTGATPNNYLFAGEQFDPALRLYYSRARYLDTATGLFLTMDPYLGNLDDPLSLHRYLYARLDPVNRSDPSGQQFTLAEVSFTLGEDSVLESIETAYHKQLFHFAVSALRCIFCLINPGYQLEAAGISMLFDPDTAEAGLKTFQAGQSMILSGYREMGKAVIDTYMNTAVDGGLEALTHQISYTVDLVKLQIDELTFSLAIVNSSSVGPIAKKIVRLRALYEIAKDGGEAVSEFSGETDEGGKACTALKIAEKVTELFSAFEDLL